MKKKLLSLFLSLCILSASVCAPLAAETGNMGHFQKTNTYTVGQYADVPGTHTFSENVQAGYEYGIMQGYGATFGVSSSITRLASIIVASRLNCIYETGANTIEETYTGTTREIYLQYAAEHNIYAAFENDALPATRAEFAAILSSALPDAAMAAINSVEDNAIPDVAVEDVYAPEIYRLYRAGILNGSDARGTFHPDTHITRGAACAIATRMCSPALRKSVQLTVPETQAAFDLSTVPAFAGKPYYAVNGNVPYFTEEEMMQTASFERYAPLDRLGRCGTAVANIGRDLMPTEERGGIGQVKPSGWHTVKYDFIDGKYLYNRCHLIGYQLTAENANTGNLITGTRYLNIQGMLPFENMTADYVKETGNHVRYRVTPVFEGQDLVASGVLMEALSVEDKGAGICFNVFCYNVQPGVIIDYATGESTLDPNAPTPEPQPETRPEPEPQPQAPVIPDTPPAAGYVLNVNSKKFHYPDCHSVDRISPEHLGYYNGPREDLIAQGYSPCGNCRP